MTSTPLPRLPELLLSPEPTGPVRANPTPPSTKRFLPVGHRLGRYRLDSVVGHGASSTAYRATDTALDLPVVVKVLAADASAHNVARFRNEILFSRRVNHPGFCRIYELHEEDTVDGPLRYLTMELVAGRTLGDVMNEGQLSPLRALQIARALCDVMHAAHRQGVVHGDLKPGNIMVRDVVDSSGAAKDELVVLDFGAAVADGVEDSGVRVGSVRYMAPELFERQRPSPQSDIWAIGVITYGCLTGRFPFDGATERAIAEATRQRPTPPSAAISAVGTPWPGAVDDVVVRALLRDRTERWSDCRVFGRALDNAMDTLLPQPSFLQRLRLLLKV